MIQILECLLFSKSSKQYSEVVRAFCLTLHFYSPKAYEYLRSTFNLNLPCTRTIRMWYTSINGSPGFTTESFDVLKNKAEELKANDKVLNVCLIFDEMAVRKHSQWDCSKKKFIGHVTAGKPKNIDEPLPLAKESLVFMVSGIGENFKIPIGYFLVSGLDAEEKASLINEAIIRIGRCNWNKIGRCNFRRTSLKFVLRKSSWC